MRVFNIVMVLAVVLAGIFLQKDSYVEAKRVNNRRRQKVVIGIFTIRYCKNDVQAVLPTYVKWMNKAGARVVPININLNRTELRKMFLKTNGVIMVGANSPSKNYVRALKLFAAWSKAAKKKGDVYPIFGVCYGMQRLANYYAKKWVIERRPVLNKAIPLNLTQYASHSRLFSGYSKSLVHSMTTKDISYNNHRYGLTPETFTKYDGLKSFKVLATSKDTNGKDFVAYYESKELDVFGTQAHPETFFFYKRGSLKDARVKNAKIASRFVRRAAKSKHNVRGMASKTVQKTYNFIRNGVYYYLGGNGPWWVPVKVPGKFNPGKDCKKLEKINITKPFV